MKLNCSVVKDIYVLYEENELSQEVRGYVKEHLDECEDCRKVYDSGISLPDVVEEKLPEPSKKLDEKLMLKLKVSRLRIALIFIVVIAAVAVYSQYSQSRKYLAQDFQKYSNDLYHYYRQVDDLQDIEKSQTSNDYYNETTGDMLNKINEEYEQSARNFNILEKHGVKGINSSQSFDPQINDLVLTLNSRWQAGHFSKKDEEVYKRLKDELQSLSQFTSEYGTKLNSKFFIMNTSKLKDSFDKLNTLARVYINYNKLPEEVKYLTEGELKDRIKYVLENKDNEIKVTKESDFEYSFTVQDQGQNNCNGEIDAVTGRILELRGGANILKGSLITVEKAQEAVKNMTLRNIGKGFDVNIKYLGTNVDVGYEYGKGLIVNPSNNSTNFEDREEYYFSAQATFKGYGIYDTHIIVFNAKSNTISSYDDIIIGSNIFRVDSSSLRANVKYSPEEALKNIAAPDINKSLFKYKGTNFIRSMLTGEYVLVHNYEERIDISNGKPRDLYINAETGKEEEPFNTDVIIG